MKYNWKDFEIKCFKYLTKKYGNYFRLKGSTDSTVSDILFNNGLKSFYIEAKENLSQCGQFVVLYDDNVKNFVFSPNNKSNENEFTNKIITSMSQNYDYYRNAGTKGKDIDLDTSIFYKWIIDYYKNFKKVEFFITNNYDDNFIIFPIGQINKFFDVSARYRIKKSGSSSLNKANVEDLKIALMTSEIVFEIKDLLVFSDTDLADKKFKGEKYNYLLKENNENSYKVRKLSNTNNANVIFSIRLKNNITSELIEINEKNFVNAIK